MPGRTALAALALAVAAGTSVPASAVLVPGTHDHGTHDHGSYERRSPGLSTAHRAEHAAFLADRQEPFDLEAVAGTASGVPCIDGFANEYPCRDVDLLAFLPLSQIGGGSGNDVWGWTDPETGREWALMGRSSGTAFVDITDPTAPVYVGNLPTATSSSSWRDIKVIDDHAFIGSEASGHGLQVFDLTRLREVDPAAMPVTFTATASYTGFGNSHNIVANEETGFVYAVGSGTCSGGLHIVDVRTPANPTGAGCYSGDGYTHDAQCVIYRGLDAEHVGKEICFNSNEDTLTIVDVTNKTALVMLSRLPYSGARYTHQGWLSEDHAWFVVDDELDEQGFGHTTRTRYFALDDLDDPVLARVVTNGNTSIDHNLYIRDGYVYQANYRSGLRIQRFLGNEVAHFDIYPSSDSASFNGAWSTFPFYDSGVVVVSGIEQGLYVLRANLPEIAGPPESPTTVYDLSVAAADGAVEVAGAGTFADEELLVGQDSAADARVRGAGAEIATASVRSEVRAGGTHLVFRLSVPDQPEGGGTPELIRTLWNFTVRPPGGAPEDFILEAAIRVQGTGTTPVLRLLDQQETELARLQGTMAGGAITFEVPASSIGATAGSRVDANPTFGVGSYLAVGGVNLDGISRVDPYPAPGPSLRVGIAPGGTPAADVPLETSLPVADDGSFAGTIDTAGLAPGSYVVAVLACHGLIACDLATADVTL